MVDSKVFLKEEQTKGKSLKYKDNHMMAIGGGEEFTVNRQHGSHFQNHISRIQNRHAFSIIGSL